MAVHILFPYQPTVGNFAKCILRRPALSVYLKRQDIDLRYLQSKSQIPFLSRCTRIAAYSFTLEAAVKLSMEVLLYVYDLSHGLAAQQSLPIIGVHIDAVYHTSIVFNKLEYFYGGIGIQTATPGSTHLGPPLQILSLGRTELPTDLISEYLNDSQQEYAPHAYNFLHHNCNNFTNDFAQFLVGRGIPDQIQSLPQTVLNGPAGPLLSSLFGGNAPVTDHSTEADPTQEADTLPSQSLLAAHSPNVARNAVDKGVSSAFTSLSTQPILFSQVPNLDKLCDKIDPDGKNDVIHAAINFIKDEHAPLPDLHVFARWARGAPSQIQLENLFAAYDLIRLVLIDKRVSSFFATHPSNAEDRTIVTLLSLVNDRADRPYKLRLVAIRLACNMFASLTFFNSILSHEELRSAVLSLAVNSMLDQEHPNLRAAAAHLAYNLATAHFVWRTTSREPGNPGGTSQGEFSPMETVEAELTAAVIEALAREEMANDETIRSLALTLGRLAYGSRAESAVREVCRAMDAEQIIADKTKDMDAGIRQLMADICQVVQ